MQSTDTWSMSRLLAVLRKYWWMIVAAGLLGSIVAYGVSSLQTPVYKSSASMYFALDQGTTAADLNQGSAYTQGQMLSFAQLATSSRVLQPVADDVGLDLTPRALARSIEVSIPLNTSVLRITATSTDPERAALLANAVAEELTVAVSEVAPKGPEGAPAITASTIDGAVPPQFQASPDKLRDTVLGGIAGGFLGIAAALVLAMLDTRVRSEAVLAEVGGAPVLGVVSRSGGLAKDGLDVANEPLGRTAEEFRRVQSALAYTGIRSPIGTVVVTSASPGEGKSTVALSLALTLANLGHSVLLIDADLRKPRMHTHLGVDVSVGLTTVLLGEIEFEQATYRPAQTGLDVLVSGGIAPNPAEVLTSSVMTDLLARTSDEFDYVVIDTPPVLNVADTALLAPLVDGAIIVANATKTRRAPLDRAITILSSAGTRVLGTVLNSAKRGSDSAAYYAKT